MGHFVKTEPDYWGRLELSELEEAVDSGIWFVKEQHDLFFDIVFFNRKLGERPQREFEDFRSHRKSLYKAKGAITELAKEVEDVDKKLKHLSLSNFLPYKMPLEMQCRPYQYYSVEEVLLQLNDSYLFSSEFAVLNIFPIYNSTHQAVVDSLIGHMPNNNLFSLDIVKEGELSYGTASCCLPGKRITGAALEMIDTKIRRRMPAVFQKQFDLVIYGANPTDTITGRLGLIRRQLLEAYEFVMLACRYLKNRGNAILQSFTLDTEDWLSPLFIMSCLFGSVYLHKPFASPSHNDEIFVVGKDFYFSEDSLKICKVLKKYIASSAAFNDATNGTQPFDVLDLPMEFQNKVVLALTGWVDFQEKYLRRGFGAIKSPLYKQIQSFVDFHKIRLANLWIERADFPSKFTGFAKGQGFDLSKTRMPKFISRKEMVEKQLASPRAIYYSGSYMLGGGTIKDLPFWMDIDDQIEQDVSGDVFEIPAARGANDNEEEEDDDDDDDDDQSEDEDDQDLFDFLFKPQLPQGQDGGFWGKFSLKQIFLRDPLDLIEGEVCSWQYFENLSRFAVADQQTNEIVPNRLVYHIGDSSESCDELISKAFEALAMADKEEEDEGTSGSEKEFTSQEKEICQYEMGQSDGVEESGKAKVEEADDEVDVDNFWYHMRFLVQSRMAVRICDIVNSCEMTQSMWMTGFHFNLHYFVAIIATVGRLFSSTCIVYDPAGNYFGVLFHNRNSPVGNTRSNCVETCLNMIGLNSSKLHKKVEVSGTSFTIKSFVDEGSIDRIMNLIEGMSSNGIDSDSDSEGDGNYIMN